MEDFAKKSKAMGVEAVIACVFQDDAKLLVDAFHDLKHPLKAFFVTVAPTDQQWVNSFDPPSRADNLLSAAQWHKDMKYTDEFFGSGLQYVKTFREKFDELEPTYGSASASAVGLILHKALLEAFRECNIEQTNGIVDELLFNQSAITCDDDDIRKLNGYGRFMRSLGNIDTQIFYGGVKFNKFRRNIGLTPVTTQVFRMGKKDDVTKRREIKAVLPLGYATDLLRFPAENYYKETCHPGSYVGPDPYDRCKQCPRGSISFRVDSDHCDSCPLGKYMDKIGQSECFSCPKGSVTLDRGAVTISNCTCVPGHYQPSGLNGSECYICSNGAICNGGNAQPYPESGFWMNETYAFEAYPCDSEKICPGGQDFDCQKGTTGRLCSECENDYFSVIEKCYKCPSKYLIVFLCIALLILWYVTNVTVSRNVASLEMLLGWAQLANIIGDINLNWTPMLTRVFGIANLLDFDVDILEPSCLISNWGFMQNFIVQLSLPFVMTTVAGLGYLSSLCLYNFSNLDCISRSDERRKCLSRFFCIPESSSDLEKKWDTTVATFLASIDITYITIAKYCFDVFKCDTIAGVSVMRSSPDVECDTRRHKVLIVLSSLGILLYVIGYSLYATWILYDLKQKKGFSNEKNLRRYGFIYEKFELDYYYIPIIIILRKLLFVLVLVYISDPSFQLGALAVIINGSLMIHVFTAPYVDTYIDILFSFLLLTLMFEAFGGLMFYNDNLPQQNRDILEWIVMVTLFVLILVFLVIFTMEMANKYYIYWMKRDHRSFAMQRMGSTQRCWSLKSTNSSMKGILERAVSLASSVGRRQDYGISFELLDTFKPSFVYQCMQKDATFIQDWDTLSDMLKDYMSDQSVTSYLSVESGAKFWRKMVDRFPEIVDFLLTVNEETRKKFKDFAEHLFQDFYLTNKIVPLPLMQVLNWRDRAPMAHWLCTASEEDRQKCCEIISRMYKTVGDEEIYSMLKSKREHGGKDPEFVARMRSVYMNAKQKQTMKNITLGRSPMDHPSATNFTSTRENEEIEGIELSRTASAVRFSENEAVSNAKDDCASSTAQPNRQQINRAEIKEDLNQKHIFEEGVVPEHDESPAPTSHAIFSKSRSINSDISNNRSAP